MRPEWPLPAGGRRRWPPRWPGVPVRFRPRRFVSTRNDFRETNFFSRSASGARAWDSSFPEPLGRPRRPSGGTNPGAGAIGWTAAARPEDPARAQKAISDKPLNGYVFSPEREPSYQIADVIRGHLPRSRHQGGVSRATSNATNALATTGTSAAAQTATAIHAAARAHAHCIISPAPGRGRAARPTRR